MKTVSEKQLHAKLFSARDTWHTLASVNEGAHKRSALLRLLFRGNGVRAFKMAAIEDDGRTKTATDGALSEKLFCTMLTRA